MRLGSQVAPEVTIQRLGFVDVWIFGLLDVWIIGLWCFWICGFVVLYLKGILTNCLFILLYVIYLFKEGGTETHSNNPNIQNASAPNIQE